MVQDEMTRFSALIDRIYQGALHPEIWPVVLSEVADWMGAPRGSLFTPLLALQDGGFTFDHNLSTESIELWRIKFQHEDLWVNKVTEKGLSFQGNVILDSDLLPEAELFASSFYKDFLALNDMARLMSGVIFDFASPDTPGTVCAMYRGRDDTPFSEADRARFHLVLPHLSRALGVMYRLRQADFKVAASLAALDQIKAGVLLLGENGETIFANRAAQRMLEEEDGLHLKRLVGNQHCQLLANDSQTQASIDAAIRSATSRDIMEVDHFAHSIAVPRLSGRTPFALQFSALDEQNEFGAGSDTARAIVFITDAATPLSVSGDSLVRLLGLSPAEARLAVVLCEGISLQEAANRLNISPNTAKTQLKHIYQKTGVDSRASLVRLMIALATKHE